IQAENAGAKKKEAAKEAPKADNADYEEKKRQEAEARKKSRRAETLKKDIAYTRKTVETLAAKMAAPEIHSDYKHEKDWGHKIPAPGAKITANTAELKALKEACEAAASQ